MKIFKYILFLLIVSSAVLLIYQQSDQKGFRRWRTSFKIACIFAASTLGLIPINREAIEPPGNNNQVYQERLRRDQEFNSSISESSNSTLTVQGGDLGKSGPGPRAKADASRNAKAGVNRAGNSKANNSQSGGSPFVEALTTNHPKRSQPGQNGDGLFSRFPSQAKPNPNNPGCSGRPRSVKVLSVEGRPVSEQLNSDSATEHSIREIIAHDGVKGRLTDKSANHLTSNHGHVLSIDDPLPPSPNQKVVKFTKIRTRINKDNKKQFADTLEKILQDPNSEPYPDVNIRGIKGHGYYNENYGEHGFFVGIHNEGEFKGQIMKAQPISEQQLEILQDENKID